MNYGLDGDDNPPSDDPSIDDNGLVNNCTSHNNYVKYFGCI